MSLFTYFPRAKHSSLTVAPLAVRTDVGKCTSILGSYSPMIPAKVKRGMQILESSWLKLLLTHTVPPHGWLQCITGHGDVRKSADHWGKTTNQQFVMHRIIIEACLHITCTIWDAIPLYTLVVTTGGIAFCQIQNEEYGVLAQEKGPRTITKLNKTTKVKSNNTLSVLISVI